MKKPKPKPKRKPVTLANLVSAVKHLTNAVNGIAAGQSFLARDVRTALAELDAQRGFVDSLTDIPAKTPTIQPTENPNASSRL